jgi:hypothetical protein
LHVIRTNLTFSLFPKIQHKVSAAHKYQYTKIFIKFIVIPFIKI